MGYNMFCIIAFDFPIIYVNLFIIIYRRIKRYLHKYK